MGLIDGSDTVGRVVFSEIHSEGIHRPCFMVRQGRYKYIYVGALRVSYGESVLEFCRARCLWASKTLLNVPLYFAQRKAKI